MRKIYAQGSQDSRDEGTLEPGGKLPLLKMSLDICLITRLCEAGKGRKVEVSGEAPEYILAKL
jgi:hypothetical protein